MHRDEGARRGGGCEISSTAPKPERKHKDRWQRRSRTSTPRLVALGERSERNFSLPWAQLTPAAAPMGQAGADPAHNVGLQHLRGHHLDRIPYFSDTYTFQFPSRSCVKPQGPTCPIPSPKKGAEGPKFGSIRRAALGQAEDWSCLLLDALNTSSRRAKHLRAEWWLAVLSTQQRVSAVRQRSSFMA